ncbi:MAG: tRNA (adenosine(37)-N6)-dimethylallyltransferase MiaA [Vicinamibacterales bacterium]
MSLLIAIVGPTAVGKSALAIALAEQFNGEVISCDSTAVYRGINIGTDKVPVAEQRGVPHHLTDVVGPTEVYSAARFAADAARVAREIGVRGRLPIVAGGTGLYYRSLVRGLFPGPARDEPLRARLDRVANTRGVEFLHRWLARVDPASGARIQPRDRKRLIRALEVYLLTGQPLTAHFSATVSPVADFRVLTLGLRLPSEALQARVERRVAAQFASGVVAEVRALLTAGLPAHAHTLSGLVYRQVRELLDGARTEAATRDLIVRENLQYARRQLVWFRAEPDVHWIDAAGESPTARHEAAALVQASLDARRESVHVSPVGAPSVVTGS